MTRDMAGAPVLSGAAVLAMPDPAHSTTGRTLDVRLPPFVIERLGLKNVSAARTRSGLGPRSSLGTLAAMTAVPNATTTAPSASFRRSIRQKPLTNKR